MPRIHALRWMVVLALALPSCAAPVAIRGAIQMPRTTVASQSRPGDLRTVVVWLDSVPAPVERRLAVPPALPAPAFRNGAIHPAMTVARAGSVVRIGNQDGVYHLPFTRTRARERRLGTSAPGDSTSVHATRAGTVRVFCRLHSREQLLIRVVPGRAYAHADRQGRFLLPPVPNGRYVVRAWHPELGEARMPVVVRGNFTPAVTLRFAARPRPRA